MKQIRVISYLDSGYDKDENEVYTYYNDTIEEIAPKLLIQEEDIKIYIKEVKEDKLVIDANNKEIILKNNESIQFECWTYDANFDGTCNRYIFILSLKEEDIINYEKTKHPFGEEFKKNKYKENKIEFDPIQNLIRSFVIENKYINPDSLISIGIYFCDKYGGDSSKIRYSKKTFDKVEFVERTEIIENETEAFIQVVDAYLTHNDIYAMATILFFIKYGVEPKYIAQNEEELALVVENLEKREDKDAFIYFLLAKSYDEGRGVDCDIEKAIKYYHKAYELGIKMAIVFEYFLEDDYENLFKISQNYLKSFSNHILYFTMGYCYFFGVGTEQNYEIALSYFKHAEITNINYPTTPYDFYFMQSRRFLGICYFCGYGVEKNILKAHNLFRFSKSPYCISSYYFEAISILVLNNDQIIPTYIFELLKKASKNDIIPAIRKLLLCYEKQYGVSEKDSFYEEIKEKYENYKTTNKNNGGLESLLGYEADKCDLIDSRIIYNQETKQYEYKILRTIIDDFD